MTTLTLNIGQAYIYRANGYTMEVEYIAPFVDPDGLGGWHDFIVKSSTQKGRITMPGVSMVKEETDTEIITISATSIERGDLRCADLSMTSVSPPSKKEANKDITVSPVSSVQPDSVDIREIDIAFTRGGRSVTNNIKGTCLQNAVLHAYSYLYRAFVQGITDVRIYLHGKRIAIQDIYSYTPVSFMDYLMLNIKN